MSILIDTIFYAAGVASTLTMSKGWSKWKKPKVEEPKVEEPFAHPFLWIDYRGSGIRHLGYKCPKCHSYSVNQKDYPICEDFCYPNPHFHFKCNSCGYGNIMRAADDK
jgi:hypothetical protein